MKEGSGISYLDTPLYRWIPTERSGLPRHPLCAKYETFCWQSSWLNSWKLKQTQVFFAFPIDDYILSISTSSQRFIPPNVALFHHTEALYRVRVCPSGGSENSHNLSHKPLRASLNRVSKNKNIDIYSSSPQLLQPLGRQAMTIGRRDEKSLCFTSQSEIRTWGYCRYDVNL